MTRSDIISTICNEIIERSQSVNCLCDYQKVTGLLTEALEVINSSTDQE